MAGCSALNCRNSTEKGYSMRPFPRDRDRRAKWIRNVGRPNWIPGRSAYLCEVHFAPEMWEKTRVDGRRRLKCCAVPTIFQQLPASLCLKKLQRKSTCIRSQRLPAIKTCEKKVFETEVKLNNNTAQNCENISFELTRVIQSNICLLPTDDNSNAEPIVSNNNTAAESELQKLELQRKIETLEQLNKYLSREYNSCLQRIRSLISEIDKIQTESSSNYFKLLLNKFLSDDQIIALKVGSKVFDELDSWSSETIKKALELKVSCGSQGYEILISQGLPLPSQKFLDLNADFIKKNNLDCVPKLDLDCINVFSYDYKFNNIQNRQ